MSSSIFNFDVVRSFVRLPPRAHLWHLLLVASGGLILAAWLHYSPQLAPVCRIMAARALSPSTEVLITGTSRIERGVDPRLLDPNTVNLSSGGLAYMTINPLIKHAISRAPNVRLVVIEFDVFLLKGHGLIKDRLFDLGLPMRDWPASKWVPLEFLLYNGGPLSAMQRIDVEYYAQSIKPQEKPPPNSNGYNPYAFYRDLLDEQSDELYGASKYLWLHRNELVAPLEEPNTVALLDLLRWLDERNIKWALVTLPHLTGWISGRPKEWVTPVEDALQTVRKVYAGKPVRYWDASSSLSPDRPYFHDGLHLNRRGVELFNRELNDRIVSWLGE